MPARLSLAARQVPWHWVLPLALALPLCVLDGRPGSFGGDLPYFTRAGEHMLSGRWSGTFGDPKLQAGPAQLLVFGAAGRLASGLGVAPSRLLAPLVELGIVALFVLAVVRLVPAGRFRRPLLLALPALFVLLANPSTVYLAGHPADAVTPILWLLAAREARSGRAVRAALLLALGSELEVWGVLGAPVLLLAPRLRDVARGLAVQAVASAAPFLPFLLAGPFRMFAYHWQVRNGSLVSLLLAPDTPFPWTWRLAQGALALATGAVVARAARGRAAGVVLVPLAVVVVRLLLDPMSGAGYYAVAVELLALAGCGFAAECATAALAPRRAVSGGRA